MFILLIASRVVLASLGGVVNCGLISTPVIPDALPSLKTVKVFSGRGLRSGIHFRTSAIFNMDPGQRAFLSGSLREPEKTGFRDDKWNQWTTPPGSTVSIL